MFIKPAAAQQSHYRLQLGGTSQTGRRFCAVEIGAEADGILADMFEKMLDVFQDQVGGRICVATAVRPQIAGREGNAHQPLALANCGQLSVGEIARVRAHTMRVGMSGDERRITDAGDIPKSLFVEMGEVDEDLKLVAGPDQGFSEIRQTRSGIGRRGTAERHAVSERVGPTPDRSERAKSSGMQDFEHLEILIDGLCAFNMKDRGEHVGVQAVLYLFNVPANAKGAL